MYSLSYRPAIHTRRQMLQSSARLFTEFAAASIVPRFMACCKVFPSQGRSPLVQHRTASCQEMAHPLLNTFTCWWPSPWRVRPYAREAAGSESSSCATSEAPPSWGQCPFFGRSQRSDVGKASCNAGVQIGVLCPEDDPHRTIKRLEVCHSSCIGLHGRMEIAGQTDERGEGARRASKLRPNYRQESFQYLLIIAELTYLPGEKPLGNAWVLGHGPGQCSIGCISEEADELGKAQGGCLSVVRVE